MKSLIYIPLLLLCAGCGTKPLGSPQNDEYTYKVVEDGAPYQKNESRYESLNEKNLTKGQKYKIVEEGGPNKDPHFLIVNITQMIGSKKGDVSNGSMLYVTDGSANYECEKMIFDLKLNEKDADIPDVSCKFKIIGVLPIAYKAKVTSSE